MANELVLISGTAHPEMGLRIAESLDTTLRAVDVGRFSDGEIQIKIEENVRGTDVFLIQPTMPPAENIMELLLLIDACRAVGVPARVIDKSVDDAYVSDWTHFKQVYVGLAARYAEGLGPDLTPRG